MHHTQLKLTQMNFKVDIYLHYYYFVMLEYHANRLITEKLFNSESHTLMEYGYNRILLQLKRSMYVR